VAVVVQEQVREEGSELESAQDSVPGLAEMQEPVLEQGLVDIWEQE